MFSHCRTYPQIAFECLGKTLLVKFNRIALFHRLHVKFHGIRLILFSFIPLVLPREACSFSISYMKSWLKRISTINTIDLGDRWLLINTSSKILTVQIHSIWDFLVTSHNSARPCFLAWFHINNAVWSIKTIRKLVLNFLKNIWLFCCVQERRLCYSKGVNNCIKLLWRDFKMRFSYSN